MTLQQLKYVITVAETGTITEAANQLFISQPSLTNAIHELEKEMNIVTNIKFYTGNVYILELFGVVAAAVCIWNIIGKINFKSYIGFFSIEYLAMYAVTIGGVFALKWYDFTMSNVIILSIEFIVTIAVITYVLVKKERIECDEINELINERMKIK